MKKQCCLGVLHQIESSRGAWPLVAVSLIVVLDVAVPCLAADRGDPWVRHAIDNTSWGADGARLDDVNGDGLPDIATGWEEGYAVRAYLHPGYPLVHGLWPSVTVGAVTDAEDAVFVDLDGDGATDVVSCAEGNTRGVFVHWAPSQPANYLNPSAWTTAMIPSSSGLAWMFAVPTQLDGYNGVDLVAGCKWGGKVGWFESPATNRRNLSLWQFHQMSGVGWTMSLIERDVDNDGYLDFIVTDRFNDVGLQGARWLRNPGTGTAAQKSPWANYFIGAIGEEAMFSAAEDLDQDGLEDLLVPIRAPGVLRYFRRLHPTQNSWQMYPITVPADVGTPKGAGVTDIDLDGDQDMVVTFANVPAGSSGVVWMSYNNGPWDAVWQDHEISGAVGIKFDLVALSDLDRDGDLDVITTEEQANTVGLGLIWYENPTFTPVPGDFDADHDVDQVDFGHLQHCISGAGNAVTEPACFDAKMDTDDDIDETDLEMLVGCLSGAGVLASPECTGS